MHKLSWLALCMALSGCSQHSTYQRPELTIAPTWQQVEGTQLAAQAGPWWREFHDPQLDKLVEAVLAANPDMHVAALRLKSARLGAEQADTNLTLGQWHYRRQWQQGSENRQRHQQSGPLAEPQLRSGFVGQACLGARSGKLGGGGKRAGSRQHPTTADRQYPGAVLAARLSRLCHHTWGTAAGQPDPYRAADADQIPGWRHHPTRSGAGTPTVGRKTGRAGLLKAQQEQARNALRLLLGRSSGPLEYAPASLAKQTIPELAVGIPADVLARRPDVKAAELRLRKTLAKGDEIRTSFYPSLTLTGSASTASDRLAQVLQNPVGTLGANLALPFLEYNRTQLAIESSDLDYQIAETEFRKQLYTALVEVEDNLAARHYGQQRLDYLQEQLSYAQEAERLAKARFQAGATGLQAWLDEQNRLWDAQQSLLAQQKEQLTTTAKIYRALGGSDTVTPR